MAIHFWLAIPIEDFFAHSHAIMQKYGVTAYLETKSIQNGKTRTAYIPYSAENAAFTACFSAQDYYGFYFTAYPFSDIQEIEAFPARFYSEQLAPYTIEGRGGCTTARTREQIHLRQLLKSPDKSIAAFYAALQRKLKTMPTLQKKENSLVNLYYTETDKILIPPNPHSNKVQGIWEEYCLNILMNKNTVRT